MIRILFLIHDLGGGGAERVLANLVNNLDPEKYDVMLMSLFGGGVNEKLICGRVKYKSVFKKTFPGNSYIMRLFSPKTLHKLFIKEKYDIEVSFLEGPSARIISGCPDKDVKLVSWFHTCFPDEKKLAEGFNGIKEAEKCFHRFDRLICVSETVKSAVKSIIPSLDDLSVIYNINESEKITERSKEQIPQGVLADSGVNIVSVGRLIPEKGYERLAKVHKKLSDEGFDIHTYILGEGPMRGSIGQYCEKNGISDSFKLLGYVDNPYKYVSRCDLFVCSSHTEGFSTAVTEALILGVPVVTTDVSGMREMLSDGEYGIITEDDDDALYEGVKKMLSSPETIDNYSQKAKERGKYFSKEKCLADVNALFDGLVN